jgi:hypothetical protein
LISQSDKTSKVLRGVYGVSLEYEVTFSGRLVDLLFAA